MSYIDNAMMTKSELELHLAFLRLSQTEAAQLLGVSARTVRRWFEGEEVPGPVDAALRAWRRLAERNLAWRPDMVSIIEDDQDQIGRHRAHTMGLADMLTRVEARGGVRLPWAVDLAEQKATLGPAEVGFYRLQSGGFSLSTYRRKDGDPDVERDRALIEDAAFCIARAFGKLPQQAKALRAAGEYAKRNSQFFVQKGNSSLSQEETAERKTQIERVGEQIEQLANTAAEGEASYRQFEAMLAQLRKLGFSITNELVSSVAEAFH